MELLIVEDEKRVAQFLKGSFEAEGYSTRVCHSIEEAESLINAPVESVDTVILDRMLAGGDGMTLIPLLKNRYPGCHILVLSAIDLAEEKARALDLGADDYLAKPFALQELSARLRALSRRTGNATSRLGQVIRCKDICVDSLSQTVSVSGRRIELSKKEYQVLSLFMQNPGRVFNKYQLLDKIWDQQFSIESNTVEVTIRHLRIKLRDAKSTLDILSRRNVGYWVEA